MVPTVQATASHLPVPFWLQFFQASQWSAHVDSVHESGEQIAGMQT